jgi:protein SCO1
VSVSKIVTHAMPTPGHPRSRLRRLGGAALLASSITVAGALLLVHRYQTPAAANAERFAYEVEPRDGALPNLWQVPSFALQDQHGAGVSERSLRGQVWIANFMFTTCTSLCPVITSKLVMLQHQLELPGLKFVSFSVDPTRDTSEALLAYAERWNRREPRWFLLRTEPSSLSAVASGMRVAVEPSGDTRDPILHTKLFFLVDGTGSVRGIYDSDDTQALARLRGDTRRLLQRATDEQMAPPLPYEGPELFRAVGCAGCHDNPQVAPPLGDLLGTTVALNDGHQVVADEPYLHESIAAPAAKVVAGYVNLMPSYDGQLTTAQIDALVSYVAGLRDTRQAPAGPASATASPNARPRYPLPQPKRERKAGPPLPAASATESPTSTPPPASRTASAPVEVVTDPVCGMSVRATEEVPHVEFEGRSYHFCSDVCRERFEAAPAKYLASPPQAMP